MFDIEFTERAKRDIEKHKKTGNRPVLNKILTFLEKLTQHPFSGTGKPEPLKYEYTGYYSRRINKEHRLIYRVTEKIVYINSAYGHYL